MALQIPCPKCGAELKLRDRALIGKVGRCPKCGHRFELIEPDAAAIAPASPPEELIRVTTARRVSEATPDSPPKTSPSVPAAPNAEPAGFPAFFEAAPPPSSLEALKRPRGPSRRAQVILGAVIAVAAVGLAWFALDVSGPGRPRNVSKKSQPAQNASYATQRDRLERTAALIAADSPTDGTAVTLDYVPAGASAVIHLRPAELWKPGSRGEETRFCLGEDFIRWADETIRAYCLLPPTEIEEATICLILGARGSDPEVATVVRPVTPLKRSRLIETFGARLPKPGESVYVGEERAFVFGREEDAEKRPLLFASAPASMAGELALAAASPGITSDAIRRTLERTDRKRHFTVAFRPAEVRVHAETLARPALRPLWEVALDRIGYDVESVAWSLHFGGDDFFSEILLRNDPAASPSRLHAMLSKSLETLPVQLLAAASKMSPAPTGKRKVIGRLPAMTEVFAESTVSGIGDRFVLFQTRLPERAGPNLALAALLAWDESARTDFDRPAPAPGGSTEPTATLAERLAKPIEVDFRRTPLEEAFAYIGGEAGVEFEIDGDALKLAGYTRNMPQTLALGRVPASKAIAEILKAPQDKLAVVLDDSNGKVIVTTRAAAEEKGLTPTAFTP